LWARGGGRANGKLDSWGSGIQKGGADFFEKKLGGGGAWVAGRLVLQPFTSGA